MNYPHISILIPIHNGIQFLDECITSILKQTYNKYEIIIGVNGFCRNSDTHLIALEYSNKIQDKVKITILDLYNIKGKSNALNEMIKHSSYDWISLLDIDDKWHPNKLECQIKYTFNYDIIGTHCRYFEDMNISPVLPIGDLKDFNFLDYNPIINSSCLIKKRYAIWEENGIEDYDLWLKLWKQGKKFYNVGIILTFHRIHDDSAFNSKGNNLLVKSLKDKYT
jgi:teichuronic acid biosynthesis glycosyltransferase TuaG